MSSDTKYSLGAVCRLTGLAPETIRAWERRYGAVTPNREGQGRRYYDPSQVERLQLLKAATDLGHSIRHVAALDNRALRDLASRPDRASIDATGRSLRRRLLESIFSSNHGEFERLLGLAAASLFVPDLATCVISPLLADIGDRWSAGELTIAQEHRASASIRDLLGAMLRAAPRPTGRPRVALATLSGERHEFGILLVHLLCAYDGIASEYLGADLPCEEIARAATTLGCPVIGIGIVGATPKVDVTASLREVAASLPPETSLWIGGPGASAASSAVREPSIVYISDYDEFRRRLAGLVQLQP